MNFTEFKVEMLRKNLSQQQLADAMGMTQGAMSKKINGVNDFSREDIAKAIKIFELTPERTKEIFFN